jgi:hypothetical protein
MGAERSQSNRSSVQTALKHFNKYLVDQGYAFQSYEAMIMSDFTQDLVGKFADYLMSVAKIKTHDTALNYLSNIKTKILADFPSLPSMTDEGWYRFTRKNTKKLYLEGVG